MNIEVTVDREACIGAQNCVVAARGVFEIDDEGLAVVVDPGAAPVEQVIEAARSCPTGAIAVRVDGRPVDLGT